MEVVFLILRLMLVTALYAFLAWAFWLLWKDLQRQAQRMDIPVLPTLSLIPANESQEGSFRFTRPEVIIGRERGCDCRLEDKTISARHARLAYHHSQWWIEDLGSKNGTFLNQERIIQAVVTTSGDELRCGQVVLRVSMEDRAHSLAAESVEE